MMERREPLLDFPLLYSLTDPLSETSNSHEDFGFYLYGQSGALCREVPAADLVRQLVSETARE